MSGYSKNPLVMAVTAGLPRAMPLTIPISKCLRAGAVRCATRRAQSLIRRSMADQTAAILRRRRPLALLMNVAQKGVYIVVNAHKGGGIQPERSAERANEHSNQR